MFSFHKPKVYRSTTGCCICKAKSSSSRFTDSKKYEDDFMNCFQLKERRSGEICNACVLLVKRWKKLPAGSDRNWQHVVDARAGPGIKSLTKFKSKNKKKTKEAAEKIIKKKHVYIKSEQEREPSPAISDELNEYVNGAGSKGSSRAATPEECDDVMTEKRLTEVCTDDKDELSVNDFIDMTYFKREKICCGVIFRGLYGEVIVCPELIKRCTNCISRQQEKLRQAESNAASNSPFHSSASASPAYSASSSSSSSPVHNVDSSADTTKSTSKLFSDSSSDSGYDDSSNQGVGENKIAKVSSINNAAKISTSSNIATSQSKPTLISETVRLTGVVPIAANPVEQFTCKPLSLVSSSSLGSTNAHPIAVPNNPLIDFAMHAAARQSVIN
ncbi:SIN3-HDAC complex-associated factor [Chelonus insularis]|uniref:SIN3-HDAC complex-associated factor n=1 Tax=Chelonus insularis TaxID=460826 RepID=UPI00158BD4B6|nr:SIN3-HDAC complex-associated factor [Chelonus insularis]XP_034941473.1 SIN3-HDAC complex-associated factor [Chelonus insularis]